MERISPGAPWTADQAEERFDWQLCHWERHGFGWRAALDCEDGTWLGFVGPNHARPEAIELAPGEVELGWWLAPAVWGRGLATEGAAAVRDDAFERVGLERLVARCRTDNPASRRVMEKIGMRRERVAIGRHGEAMLIYALERPGGGGEIGEMTDSTTPPTRMTRG